MPDSDGCIYSVTDIGIIDSPTTRDPFEIEGPSVVFPPLIHQRFSNQSGLFSIQQNPLQPFAHEQLKRRELHRGLKHEALIVLRRLGITISFLFPGLDSLTRELAVLHGVADRIAAQFGNRA